MLPFPFLQSSSPEMGDLEKWRTESYSSLSSHSKLRKKKTSHMISKLTLHTERKGERGDGIKRPFLLFVLKLVSDRPIYVAVIFNKLIGLNESYFFLV